MHEMVDSLLQAVGIIPLSEGRDHILFHDRFRLGIMNEVPHALSKLDARGAILGCERHEKPIVESFAPQSPGVRHTQRISLDRLTGETWNNQHGELMGCLAVVGS